MVWVVRRLGVKRLRQRHHDYAVSHLPAPRGRAASQPPDCGDEPQLRDCDPERAVRVAGGLCEQHHAYRAIVAAAYSECTA